MLEHAFKREYDALQWESGDVAWRAWCEGRTGYPLVDAAMRQLSATGAMHNRLRMLAASFLVKDLGIDWRRGERWFAAKLLDYDLAANNGGWQWAASTGCDAQPWFRIFNPVTQSRKFDSEGAFIRRYVPELARFARDAGNHGADAWLNELAWRDFYFQILWHHPHAARSAFKREYAKLRWPGSKEHFKAWCEARTGYPIIDAAMRQLNTTGYMHNRLRMVVASFLAKDLLVDWRNGEGYFARHLIDFDLAANNGGWQWAASTGCDAQPYFRIFNPVTQSQRFDPKGNFIRHYLPQLAKVPDSFIHSPWTMGPLTQDAVGCIIGRDYPAPIVEHAVQREKALALFASVKG